MRRYLAPVLLAVLAACSAPGPGPGPAPEPTNPLLNLILNFRVVAQVTDSDLDVRAYAGTVPLLSFLRAYGTGSITIQTRPPFVTTDGDGLTVEPLPGHEARVAHAIKTGGLMIRGKSGLSAPGTINSRLFPEPAPASADVEFQVFPEATPGR